LVAHFPNILADEQQALTREEKGRTAKELFPLLWEIMRESPSAKSAWQRGTFLEKQPNL
jgi:hypothetical protein